MTCSRSPRRIDISNGDYFEIARVVATQFIAGGMTSFGYETIADTRTSKPSFHGIAFPMSFTSTRLPGIGVDPKRVSRTISNHRTNSARQQCGPQTPEDSEIT
jgi:hypothetical protein